MYFIYYVSYYTISTLGMLLLYSPYLCVYVLYFPFLVLHPEALLSLCLHSSGIFFPPFNF